MDTVYKYDALGNDMLVVDPTNVAFLPKPGIIRRLCDRHHGIGADGVCWGPLAAVPDRPTMRFFNPDGSEAEKSGNGLRIFARYLIDAGYVSPTQREFEIGINNERIPVSRIEGEPMLLSMQIGQPSFWSTDLPMTGARHEVVNRIVRVGSEDVAVTAVSVGNPHCVLFDRDPQQINVLGPLLEQADIFPNGINVQIVQVVDEHTIRIKIWERGAGYTLSSGTSACATASAAVRRGFCQSPISVIMDGGTATVAMNSAGSLILTGPVRAVFRCELQPDFSAGLMVDAN